MYIFKVSSYSMYVVSRNEIFYFDNIDRPSKGQSQIKITGQLLPRDQINGRIMEFTTDCRSDGLLIFDHQSMTQQNEVKCFKNVKEDVKFSKKLDGQKKFLKFFKKDFLVEVREERGNDVIEIHEITTQSIFYR